MPIHIYIIPPTRGFVKTLSRLFSLFTVKKWCFLTHALIFFAKKRGFARGARGFCGGLFEKSPPHPQKLPKQKGLLPSEGSANNVLPFFVWQRGVFARRSCNTGSGSCPARSWTSSKPRPTGCLRTEATPHPPLPRSPFSHRRRLILVALGRANTVRPYGVWVLCGATMSRRTTPHLSS